MSINPRLTVTFAKPVLALISATAESMCVSDAEVIRQLVNYAISYGAPALLCRYPPAATREAKE